MAPAGLVVFAFGCFIGSTMENLSNTEIKECYCIVYRRLSPAQSGEPGNYLHLGATADTSPNEHRLYRLKALMHHATWRYPGLVPAP
ncbi:hypothetical protein MBH78_07605 [Oceanimonas sp. NS1]|nr:hypothetical protein [Oceanimonas sp. NS1]